MSCQTVGEMHGSKRKATGVARRSRERRLGGLTHADNLSSVPELPLDSNLRPIDSLDTCWGDLPKGGVGGTFPRVETAKHAFIANTIFQPWDFWLVCGMGLMMGWRASPAASMQE